MSIPGISSTLGNAKEHFKEVSRALSSLRKNEDFSNLQFVCYGLKIGTEKPCNFTKINCHKEILAPHSKLLRELFTISNTKDPSGMTCISLEGVNGTALEKVIEYLYSGQTKVEDNIKKEMVEVCDMVGLDIVLMNTVSSESSDEDESTRPPPGKTLRLNPAAVKALKKQDKLEDKKGDKGSKSDQTDVAKTDKATKRGKEDQKKEKDSNKITMGNGRPDSSASKEKKSVPSKSGTEPRKPEKSIMKILSSDSSDSESESKVDGKSKPKTLPAESGNASKQKNDSNAANKEPKKDISSDMKPSKTSEEPNKKRQREDSGDDKTKTSSTPNNAVKPKMGPASKIKMGPASKVKKRKEETSAFLPCMSCGAVFLAEKAFKEHQKIHANFSSSSSEIELPEIKVTKPGPKSKKSPDVIKVERKERENKIFSSSSDDDIEMEVKDSVKKIDLQKKTHDSADKKPADSVEKKTPKLGPKSKRPGPASKAKPSGVQSSTSASFLVTSSEDESNKSSQKKNKEKKPKIGLSFGSDKKPKKRNVSIDGGGGTPRKCNYCDEIKTNASNMKNHSLNHFKDKFSDLPFTGPFVCPLCGILQRDRITLMRHYAFTHKMIEQYASKEELYGSITTYSSFMEGITSTIE